MNENTKSISKLKKLKKNKRYFFSSGQTCVTGSRILIQKSIYNQMIPLLIEKTKKIKMGLPVNYQTQMGPVISRFQEKKIHRMIEKAKKEGGKILCGGGKPGGWSEKGFYIEPTIIECKSKNQIAQKEVFGPVLAVISFEDEKEAINCK